LKIWTADDPSLAILVNRRDVVGTLMHPGASRRGDVPTGERLVSALTRR
jgi:hypothetical protein